METTNEPTEMKGPKRVPIIIPKSSNDTYLEEVKAIRNYLSIGGLFNLKDGDFHSLAGEPPINSDPFTFKEYSMPIQKNLHDMYEIPINLTDVSLLGSESSIEKSKELLSTF